MKPRESRGTNSQDGESGAVSFVCVQFLTDLTSPPSMLVIRQNADTFTIMSQEFYSSASSDDQSSINSVVHVDIGDSTTDGEEGDVEGGGVAAGGEQEGPEDGRCEAGGEDGDSDGPGRPDIVLPTAAPRDPHDDSSTDSDDEGMMRDRADQEDSDSSSSSEGTQV